MERVQTDQVSSTAVEGWVDRTFKKREGVPETGTKPLRALRDRGSTLIFGKNQGNHPNTKEFLLTSSEP